MAGPPMVPVAGAGALWRLRERGMLRGSPRHSCGRGTRGDRMLEIVTGVLLILVPLAFNVAFFALGRAFDYPDILRREPDDVLRRFHAGGSGLLLRWEALLVSALAMLPLAVLLAVVLGASPALTGLSIVVGATAALVQ